LTEIAELLAPDDGRAAESVAHAAAAKLDEVDTTRSTRRGVAVAVVSIDVDANPLTTRAYGVMSMPTLALFVGRKPVVQFVGAKPRTAIMLLIESHLPVATG
jgi:thioredoxin 1